MIALGCVSLVIGFLRFKVLMLEYLAIYRETSSISISCADMECSHNILALDAFVLQGVLKLAFCHE